MFIADTKVLMADGSTKNAKDLRLGELIRTKEKYTRIVNVWKGMEDSVFCIELENGSKIKTTDNQLFLTSKGMINAEKITEDNILKSEEMKEVKIKNIVNETEGYGVYGFDLEDKDSLICINGIWVGSSIY